MKVILFTIKTMAIMAFSLCLFVNEVTAVSQKQISNAVSTMRGIVPEKMSNEQKEKKAKELDEAWMTLQAAGMDGVNAIKTEIKKIDQTGEKDDFFKLGAAAVIWYIQKEEAAETIAGIWNAVPLSSQYRYVFYTAFEAAQTQDLRVILMLESLLKDNKGSIHIPEHAMELKWPVTLQFIWGAFGTKGSPELEKVLATSINQIEQQSTIYLLAYFYYIPALSKIREIAQKGNGPVREQAVEALGVMGHPDDFQFLVEGLKTSDPKLAFAHVWALVEYRDLRAVPSLIPLLKADDKDLWQETVTALQVLLTPQGIAALEAHLKKTADQNQKEKLNSVLKSIWDELLKIKPEEYASKTDEERKRLVGDFHKAWEKEFAEIQTGDKSFTRKDLKAAIDEYKKNHRLTGGSYEWVEPRHIIAIARPEDINQLLEVRAALFWRLSDECLHEINQLNQLLSWLVRSQYRKDPWITEQVTRK